MIQPASDAPPQARPETIDGVPVLVYALYGRDVRLINRCPHQGTPLDLLPGRVFSADGRHLVCATHGALFDPASGLCLKGPCKGKRLEFFCPDTNS